MTMEYVGNAQNLGCFEHGSRKQRKTFGIVGIVPSGSPVQGLAIEIRRIVHEKEVHARMTATRHHGTESVVVVKRNSNAADGGLRIGKFGLAIAGHIDAYLVPGSNQSSRQSAHHVGESTRLRKRHALRSSKSNMHENRPPNSGPGFRRKLSCCKLSWTRRHRSTPLLRTNIRGLIPV